jgi:GNAT superfamily N-acetyltransferase
MVFINSEISLQPIQLEDSKLLFELMQQVYPLAYDYFWEDAGNWYVNSQYSRENILKELQQDNADYYFVVYKEELVGNFRIIWDEFLPDLEEELLSVKLHRVYLHNKTQGKGIGKVLLKWLENEAIKKQYELIWLDAMDEKPQAFSFYKKLGYQYHSHCFLPFDLLYDKYRKMSQLYKKLV